ncbi:MAG: Diacylglycerol kinase catalytic region, partial [Candidatus Berkelbacteria bacterium Licking1014_2]
MLTELGIAGETVNPSPARTVDELIGIGIDKGYSTIVAAGNDHHLNKTFSAFANVSKNLPTAGQKTVLGFIPINPGGAMIDTLGYGQDLTVSLANLKFRKIRDFNVMTIEPNKHFLSQIQMSVARPIKLVGEINNFKIEAMATDLVLNSQMVLKLYNSHIGNNWLRRSC